MRLEFDEYCFVCGPENQAGLRVRFEAGEGRCSASFTPGPGHQGYASMTHGGILAALLDEALVYAGASLGPWVATAEMSVRYRRPAPVGTPLRITGVVTGRRGRMVEASAEVRTEAGDLLATATGKLMQSEESGGR
jgi:uncharacterized protein (TIGR00369 family)